MQRGRWQARPGMRISMQSGGSHASLPGCTCLVHLGYLIAGLASRAFEIQVALRPGSGSTRMYLVYPSELESLFMASARQLRRTLMRGCTCSVGLAFGEATRGRARSTPRPKGARRHDRGRSQAKTALPAAAS